MAGGDVFKKPGEEHALAESRFFRAVCRKWPCGARNAERAAIFVAQGRVQCQSIGIFAGMRFGAHECVRLHAKFFPRRNSVACRETISPRTWPPLRCSARWPVKACSILRCARRRCVHWYMPWRERPGPRDFMNFSKRLRKGDDSVEDGNVRAASEWCATGTVWARRSEIVCSFQRTATCACGCQALVRAIRFMRRAARICRALRLRRGHGQTCRCQWVVSRSFIFRGPDGVVVIFLRCEWAVPHLFSSVA